MGKITRRDFLNGTLLAAGATMIPPSAYSNEFLNLLDPEYYPPSKIGLRGSHPGSYESAHQRAWGAKSDWGSTDVDTDEYDLIIVGAGISGLAAAYYYQKEHGTDKKILILDNHDDFGGHAKRNEHTIDGETKIAYGGSQTLESPSDYTKNTRELLDDLKIEFDKFDDFFDDGFFKSRDLQIVTYFDKETYGENKVVKYPIADYGYFLEGICESKITSQEAIAQMPLDDEAKAQLSNIFNDKFDPLKNMSWSEKYKYLESNSYFDVLKNNFNVSHPDVFKMMRSVVGDYHAVGTDCLSVFEAIYGGAPGFSKEVLIDIVGAKEYRNNFELDDPYIHHFPDGNASVARLLVRKLIPGTAKGDDMEDIVLARMKYGLLDNKDNNVRIRLNSTVVKVEHEGDLETAKRVKVDYINNGKSYQVKGKKVILACYNMMIPHLVSGLPAEQAAALKNNVKAPLVYTNIGLKNWRGFKEKNIGLAVCPGTLHSMAFLDFPVSMGGYNCTSSPNDPIVMNMVWIPYGDTYGAPPQDQFKEGRYKILGKTFNDFETSIKSHLGGMLEGTDFDPNNDISSITVNRWSHGYSWAGTDIHDHEMHENAKIGRAQFGRISIANSDAGANAYVWEAIDQAKRAVDELKD